MLPLTLACIHSIVGIKVVNYVISNEENINALGNIKKYPNILKIKN